MATRKKTPQILDGESAQTPPPAPSRKRSARRSTKKPPQSTETQPSSPTASPFPVPISVSVTAPAQLANAIRGGFSQALEAFSDIQVVETGADWTLVVLGVGVQTTGHDTDGVALSVTIVQALAASERRTQALAPEGLFHDAWLRLGAAADLERLCRQIAANFHDRYIAVLHAQSPPGRPA